MYRLKPSPLTALASLPHHIAKLILGLLVAPVRFTVLLDDCVAWRSHWMDMPGHLEQCYCKVRGSCAWIG